MRGIQNAAVDRVLHLAGLNDGIHWQKFDLERAAAIASHAVDIGLGVFQEDTATPGGLHFQCCAVVFCDSWRRKRTCTGHSADRAENFCDSKV